MPVYGQSYPVREATPATRFRWLPIVRRELQVLLTQRSFRLLLVAAAVPTLLYLLEIYSVNRLASDPDAALTQILRRLEAVRIDASFFLDFLRVQVSSAFILILYAGSGLLCDDLRYNLVEVYFSKPLTLRDYLLGKFATLAGIGLATTALPVCLLFVAHFAMTPDRTFFAMYHWLPLSGLLFSLALVVPASLAALACSALTRSRGYAAAALIALIAVDSFMAWGVADLLKDRAIRVFSVPSAIDRLGERLFRQPPTIPVAWPTALAVVGGVALVGFAVVHRRIRKVETAS